MTIWLLLISWIIRSEKLNCPSPSLNGIKSLRLRKKQANILVKNKLVKLYKSKTRVRYQSATDVSSLSTDNKLSKLKANNAKIIAQMVALFIKTHVINSKFSTRKANRPKDLSTTKLFVVFYSSYCFSKPRKPYRLLLQWSLNQTSLAYNNALFAFPSIN